MVCHFFVTTADRGDCLNPRLVGMYVCVAVFAVQPSNSHAPRFSRSLFSLLWPLLFTNDSGCSSPYGPWY